jgi:hypothetical protein
MNKCRYSLAAAALALLGINGCIFVDDDHGHHDDDGYGGPPQEPYYTTIDRDQVLSTDLGDGAGLFVEYTSGGTWSVWTSCDTLLTDHSCVWEVSIVSQAAIDTVDAYGLEPNDEVARIADATNRLAFFAETTFDSDEIVFTTEPGALVSIVAWLDGYDAPGYLVWFGNGEVRPGAPRSPVVFQPDAP